LSISAGISFYDPERPCTIDDLLATADRSMYERKMKKPCPARNGIHF
jgi:two-component system cell cycle response regulator